MIVILQQQISENAEPDAIIFFMKSETYFDDNWLLWCLRKDYNQTCSQQGQALTYKDDQFKLVKYNDLNWESGLGTSH